MQGQGPPMTVPPPSRIAVGCGVVLWCRCGVVLGSSVVVLGSVLCGWRTVCQSFFFGPYGSVACVVLRFSVFGGLFLSCFFGLWLDVLWCCGVLFTYRKDSLRKTTRGYGNGNQDGV